MSPSLFAVFVCYSLSSDCFMLAEVPPPSTYASGWIQRNLDNCHKVAAEWAHHKPSAEWRYPVLVREDGLVRTWVECRRLSWSEAQ
jgi:hypothetical protein